MARHTGLFMKYGMNTFVIRYPAALAAAYPQHVRSASFYGRLVNADTIVGVDIALTPGLHNDGTKVGGFNLFIARRQLQLAL